MKSVLIVIMVSIISTMAQADVVNFEFWGFSGFDNNFINYEISSAKDGKIKISSAGKQEIIDPKLVNDRRGSDGNLELDLGQNRTLIVTSGFSNDGVSYLLKIADEYIRLSPIVFTSVNNKGE